MATVALRKFTNADTLKRIGGHYLFPLLAPHRPFFAGRGLILPPEENLKCGKLKAESGGGAGGGENGNSTLHPIPHPQPSDSLAPARSALDGPSPLANSSRHFPSGGSPASAGEGHEADGNGQIDCEKLASIFMTPDTDMPRELADALYLIHEMATKEGMDKLQAAAERCRPPLNLNGADEPADVAVRVWLSNRSLLEEVNAEHELARPKAFLSYLMDDGPVPQFMVPTEARRREWEKRMDEWFEKKKRGSGCRVLIYPRDGECWFLVRHGEPFRREGSYDGGEPGSVFYRPQQHDVLIYDTVGGELRIHAGTQGERELYRRNFGRFVFEDENFFPGEGKYTLQPLIADGADALNCQDVEGIDWVKLKELEFLWLGSGRSNPEREIRKANDLFAAFETRGFKLKEGHDLKRAVFQVKFTDAKRPRSVMIAPTNRAKYERDDDGTFLEAWLKKRGFILEHHENDGTVANA